MKKIPIKIEGLSAQEFVEILSNNDIDNNITFEIEEAKEDERSWNDIVKLIVDNTETVLTFLGTLYTVGNLFIKYQSWKLNKKKLELEKAKHKLDREKFELEKAKFEAEQAKLNKPKAMIIQQNIGDDIFLPFDFKNEEDFINFLKQKSLNLRTENIKSIDIK